jgi:hypothetical protein
MNNKRPQLGNTGIVLVVDNNFSIILDIAHNHNILPHIL